jgi:hypothetical protein
MQVRTPRVNRQRRVSPRAPRVRITRPSWIPAAASQGLDTGPSFPGAWAAEPIEPPRRAFTPDTQRRLKLFFCAGQLIPLVCAIALSFVAAESRRDSDGHRPHAATATAAMDLNPDDDRGPQTSELADAATPMIRPPDSPGLTVAAADGVMVLVLTA